MFFNPKKWIVLLSCLLDRLSSSLPSLQAIRGNAIDRHLLGLKLQAIEDLVSMPELFMDTAYAVAMHFNLSTSQVGLIQAKTEVLSWFLFIALLHISPSFPYVRN